MLSIVSNSAIILEKFNLLYFYKNNSLFNSDKNNNDIDNNVSNSNNRDCNDYYIIKILIKAYENFLEFSEEAKSNENLSKKQYHLNLRKVSFVLSISSFIAAYSNLYNINEISRNNNYGEIEIEIIEKIKFKYNISNSEKKTEIPEKIILFIQNVIFQLIVDYPSYSNSAKNDIKKILNLLAIGYASLNNNNNDLLNSYLDGVVSLLLLKSVSRQEGGSYNFYEDIYFTDENINNNEDDNFNNTDQNLVSYDNEINNNNVNNENNNIDEVPNKPLLNIYLSLWKELFEPTDDDIKKLLLLNKIDYNNDITLVLSDCFLSKSLQYLRKLDLSYNINNNINIEEEKDENNINANRYVPNNPIDQGIYLTKC